MDFDKMTPRSVREKMLGTAQPAAAPEHTDVTTWPQLLDLDETRTAGVRVPVRLRKRTL